jgi:hypothetical protein
MNTAQAIMEMRTLKVPGERRCTTKCEAGARIRPAARARARPRPRSAESRDSGARKCRLPKASDGA